MSPVVDATTQESRPAAIAAAAEAVRAGELVVLPTDTVYGVGCDAFSADAVARVLEAKGRGREMPPPVLIHDVRTLDGLAIDVPPYVRDLVERYWPGPLTVIVQAQPSLHWDLGDTFGTVALRVPDDPIARELLKEIGPMAVTSANRTGQPPATTVLDAATQLGAAVRRRGDVDRHGLRDPCGATVRARRSWTAAGPGRSRCVGVSRRRHQRGYDRARPRPGAARSTPDG